MFIVLQEILQRQDVATMLMVHCKIAWMIISIVQKTSVYLYIRCSHVHLLTAPIRLLSFMKTTMSMKRSGLKFNGQRRKEIKELRKIEVHSIVSKSFRQMLVWMGNLLLWCKRSNKPVLIYSCSLTITMRKLLILMEYFRIIWYIT